MPSMKISRTSSSLSSASAGKAAGVGGPEGKGFAAKLGATKSKDAIKTGDAVAKSDGAKGSPPVSDIGADLKAGRLTPQAAIDKVIERVLDRQVGRKAAASVRQRLGAALRESLTDDPMLAAKVRALGEE